MVVSPRHQDVRRAISTSLVSHAEVAPTQGRLECIHPAILYRLLSVRGMLRELPRAVWRRLPGVANLTMRKGVWPRGAVHSPTSNTDMNEIFRDTSSHQHGTN